MLIAFGCHDAGAPAAAPGMAANASAVAAAARTGTASDGFRRGRPAGPESFSEIKLNEAIVFSSVNRRVETQQFEGGKLDVVFGSIELDLSEASIASPARQAELEAECRIRRHRNHCAAHLESRYEEHGGLRWMRRRDRSAAARTRDSSRLRWSLTVAPFSAGSRFVIDAAADPIECTLFCITGKLLCCISPRGCRWVRCSAC